jgi:hypothetical protein
MEALPAESNSSQPSRVSTANLSLGFAVLLSVVFSSGAWLLKLVGTTLALRLLQPYQSHLANAFASYWIPAIFIYLLLRLAHIDRKLSCNKFVHGSFFIANLLLFIYISARVFASTVPGGGGSFAVISLSPLIVFPALGLLVVGAIVLTARTLRTRKDTESQPPPIKFGGVEWVPFAIVVAIPIVFSLTLPIGRMYKLANSFSHLCETAEIKYLEQVVGAKSVALLPDMFAAMDSALKFDAGNTGNVGYMNGVTWRSQSAIILNQSLLEFVEVPKTNQKGLSDQAEFERISTEGKRVLQGNPSTQYLTEPIGTLTAEYEVRPVALNLAELGGDGLAGSRIEIRRRADNKLVAYAQYYWNGPEFKACPKEIIGGVSVFRFVRDALGVRNPESSIK